MDNLYYAKYLKYKTKFLNEKQIISLKGGVKCKDCGSQNSQKRKTVEDCWSNNVVIWCGRCNYLIDEFNEEANNHQFITYNTNIIDCDTTEYEQRCRSCGGYNSYNLYRNRRNCQSYDGCNHY